MKQFSKTTFIIPIFFLLIISYSTSARLLPTHQAQEGSPLININEISLQEDDVSSLMGLMEKCGDRDEDCIQKRRMVAEAHLDYIYTQHHKP